MASPLQGLCGLGKQFDKPELAYSIIGSCLEVFSAYHWFLTNGEYLFHIMAEDVDRAFMQELMESVQPIEDITTYFDQE